MTYSDSRRWWVLAAACGAQFLVILNGTIVSVAMPVMQRELLLDDAARGWIINAYAIAFGGLLLIGGRISDRIGAKRSFLIGVVGFTLATVVVAVAAESVLVLAARAGQGVFAALLMPSVMSILSQMFVQPRDRARAFGVSSIMATAGGATGLVLGGVLTDALGWRWCFVLLLPVATTAAMVVWRLLPVSMPNPGVRIGLVSAMCIALGFALLIYAVAEIQVTGITSPATLIPFGGGLLAVAGFLFAQVRSRTPLIPARIIRGERKATALAAIAVSSIGMTGAMLLLTYHVQDVMGAAPATTGLLLLPLPLSIVAASLGLGSTLLGRFDPFVLLVPGTLAGVLGALLLVGISPESSYPLQLLPAMVLIGASLGVVGVASLTVMLSGTSAADAGVASAVQQSSQQVSAALGLAVFNAIGAAVTAGVASSGELPEWALDAGLGTAAWTLVVASGAVLPLVVAVLVRSVRRKTVRLAFVASSVRPDAAALSSSEGL